MQTDKNTYWAAKLGSELTADLSKKLRDNVMYKYQSTLYRRAIKLFNMYYGDCGVATSFGLTAVGDRGQNTTIYANKVRSLAQFVMAQIVPEELTFSARPKSSDVKAKQQSIVGSELANAITKSKDVIGHLRSVVEQALITNSGYLHCFWDFQGGKHLGMDPETGVPLFEGDIAFESFGDLSVVMDPISEPGREQWAFVCARRNRYDLAAAYPEVKEEIMNVSIRSQLNSMNHSWSNLYDEMSDYVLVYYFYHKSTPACPQGAQCVFLTDELYLSQGPLGYDYLPVLRMTPANVLGTGFGYSPLNDLLAPVDGYNAMLSIALSNAMTHGRHNLLNPRGNGLDFGDALGDGAVIDYDVAPPSFLQYPGTPPEVFNLAETFDSLMTEQLGQNDASTGQIASSSRMPSSAMAMLEQKAAQSVGPLRAAVEKLLPQIGNTILMIFSRYATQPRMQAFLGKNNAYRSRYFTGDELGQDIEIYMEIGNAMNFSPSMRYDVAVNAMQNGLLKSLPQFAEYMQTGAIESEYNPESNKWLRILSENEQLQVGVNPPVLITDDPVLHCQGHLDVMNTPGALETPEVSEAVMQHLIDHFSGDRAAFEAQFPQFVMLLNQQSVLVPQMMQQDPAAAKSAEQTAPAPVGAEEQPAPEAAPPPGEQPPMAA